MAERAVQTVKNFIKKAIIDKRHSNLALLENRNALVSDSLSNGSKTIHPRTV